MSVARSSLVFSAGTFLSRISGLIRDSVVSAVFGASIFLDAYNVANRIPNLLRELLAEGALGASFTKVYSQLCVTSKEDAQKLLVETIQLTALVSIFIVSLGIIFAEPLVWLTTSSDRPHDLELLRSSATGLTQIIFPFIGFLSLGAIFQSVLYQRGGFFLVAVSPILFNLATVLGALAFGPLFSNLLPISIQDYFGNAAILGLAAGTVLGGALQAGVQLLGIWKPVLSRASFVPKKFPWSPNIKKVVTLMGPMIIAASAGQVNVIVNTNFATSLETGTTTWLGNAFRMLQFPIGMFGVAIGAAVLPALSKSFANANGKVNEHSSKEITDALELVTWLMVPCSLLLYGNAEDITRLLFQAGKYNATDTIQTAIALQGYSLGLLGYGMIKVLNSYYYAVDRTKFPMWVGLFSIGVNFLLNYMLVKKFGHEGLAITASVILSMNATILYFGMMIGGFRVRGSRIASCFGLLFISTIATLGLRYLYTTSLAASSIAQMIGLSGTIGLKLDSGIRILLDAVVVTGIFLGFGLFRLKCSPKDALRRLKRK